jgi:hypothetical protein
MGIESENLYKTNVVIMVANKTYKKYDTDD